MLMMMQGMVFVSLHDILLWWLCGPGLLVFHLRKVQAVLLLPLPLLSLAEVVLVGSVAVVCSEVVVHRGSMVLRG
jgi:hypothetical protein